jgi:hypothetical protein
MLNGRIFAGLASQNRMLARRSQRRKTPTFNEIERRNKSATRPCVSRINLTSSRISDDLHRECFIIKLTIGGAPCAAGARRTGVIAAGLDARPVLHKITAKRAGG